MSCAAMSAAILGEAAALPIQRCTSLDTLEQIRQWQEWVEGGIGARNCGRGRPGGSDVQQIHIFLKLPASFLFLDLHQLKSWCKSKETSCGAGGFGRERGFKSVTPLDTACSFLIRLHQWQEGRIKLRKLSTPATYFLQWPVI